MIIVMDRGATAEQLHRVEKEIESRGLKTLIDRGDEETIIAVRSKITGNVEDIAQHFLSYDGVDRIIPISQLNREITRKQPKHSAAGRPTKEGRTLVRVGSVVVGNGSLVVTAGSCAIETRDQTLRAADAAVECGADMLRMMLFKPRTEQSAWQGIGKEGLPIALEVRKRFPNIPIVSEAVRTMEIPYLLEFADAFQIGTRNAQNYELLEAIMETGKPVILKRGMGNEVKEWFGSATYLVNGFGDNVIFCERGIRTFESKTRFTLDISAIPVVQHESRFPIIIDPSHASGKRHCVRALACGAVATGADGLLIDVHPNPEEARVDGPQQLKPEEFRQLMLEVRAHERVRREFAKIECAQ